MARTDRTLFNGPDLIGVTKIRFPDQVKCAASAIDETETEISFKAQDGNVYKMDTGFRFGILQTSMLCLNQLYGLRWPYAEKTIQVSTARYSRRGCSNLHKHKGYNRIWTGESSRGLSQLLYTAPGSLGMFQSG